MFRSHFKVPVIMLVVLSSVMTGSCALISTENDDCDATKMIDVKEPVIYLRAVADPGQMDTNTSNAYYLSNASKIQFTGSVQKIYCSGKKSGYFSYSPTLFPQDYTESELRAGLFLPQPYQYKFENDLDKLIVIITCKAWFSDGKIFEVDTVSREFFYKDIKYEVNQLKYYILIDVVDDVSIWKQVTS